MVGFLPVFFFFLSFYIPPNTIADSIVFISASTDYTLSSILLLLIDDLSCLLIINEMVRWTRVEQIDSIQLEYRQQRVLEWEKLVGYVSELQEATPILGSRVEKNLTKSFNKIQCYYLLEKTKWKIKKKETDIQLNQKENSNKAEGQTSNLGWTKDFFFFNFYNRNISQLEHNKSTFVYANARTLFLCIWAYETYLLITCE